MKHTIYYNWNFIPFAQETLPKAQRTRGLSSTYQIHLFKVISHVQEKILDQDYLQNLDQASISKFQPKISISTIIMGSTGMYWDVIDFNGLYWAIMGCTGL